MRAVRVLQALGDQVVKVIRPMDKKMVLFYNDQAAAFSVDDGM